MIPRTSRFPTFAWIAAALALAAGLAVLFLLPEDGDGRWSAATPQARAELEAGERARARYYRQEAVERFEAALEADPDNVMARLFLFLERKHLDGGPDRVNELLEELRAADLEELTPRERLLVGFYLAQVDRDPERALALLTAYLEEHPRDPYGVELRCGHLWARARWDEAEACYQELIRLDPNRVEAQNRIGYIRMARGEFADAETQFQIYEFLAPDQANPHDSMGELYLITGRYGEAEEELRRALEMRPDFCASWTNLVLLELVRAELAAAEAVLEEARRADGCPPEVLEEAACRIELWRHAADERWSAAWDAARACGDFPVDFHVAALSAAGAGRTGDLGELEERIVGEYGTDGERGDSPTLKYLAAVRAWSAGRPAVVAERALEADERLFYWSGQWHPKLLTRRLAAAALRQEGRTGEADALEREIEAVHPGLVLDPPFPLPPPGAGETEDGSVPGD